MLVKRDWFDNYFCQFFVFILQFATNNVKKRFIMKYDGFRYQLDGDFYGRVPIWLRTSRVFLGFFLQTASYLKPAFSSFAVHIPLICRMITFLSAITYNAELRQSWNKMSHWITWWSIPKMPSWRRVGLLPVFNYKCAFPTAISDYFGRRGIYGKGWLKVGRQSQNRQVAAILSTSK